MISWHKVGQKVACRAECEHIEIEAGGLVRPPTKGIVYTVAAVEVYDVPGMGKTTGFELAEMPNKCWYAASLFEPVYPAIIEQLRILDASVPSPERAKEEA